MNSINSTNPGNPIIGQLKKNQREAISRYLSILTQKYKGQISEVIFYGSAARGESLAESDIDLLIVTSNGDQELRDEISMAGLDLAYPVNSQSMPRPCFVACQAGRHTGSKLALP